jgi:hypothetical protein
MRVDGKLQRIPVGTELTLTEAQADSSFMKSRTADPKDVKSINASGEDAAPEGNAELKKAQADLKTLAEQFTLVQKENVALKKAQKQ